MIPARGARTARESGINDGGYRVSGARQKRSPCCLQSCWQSRHDYPPPSELHRCLIRTGLAARVAHLIGIGGMATATWGIGVGPVIQGGDDYPAITIDVDI